MTKTHIPCIAFAQQLNTKIQKMVQWKVQNKCVLSWDLNLMLTLLLFLHCCIFMRNWSQFTYFETLAYWRLVCKQLCRYLTSHHQLKYSIGKECYPKTMKRCFESWRKLFWFSMSRRMNTFPPQKYQSLPLGESSYGQTYVAQVNFCFRLWLVS